MKHYLLSKTLVLTMVLMLLAGLIAQRSYGQTAASATWALTSTGNDVNAGALTGTSLAKGSNISTVSYASTGVSSTGWSTSTLSTTRYYEFDVTPTTGNNLTVTSMSMLNSLSTGTGTVQVQYSVGTSFGTGTVVGIFPVGTTEASNAFNSFSIAVNSGQTIFIRMYAYGLSNTSASFRAHNFVVSGTTIGIPPTLTAASGATVDNSFNVTFTDNSSWRSAITSVQWGSTTLVNGTDYTITAGVLKIIPGNAIKISGTQNLTIVASNYNNDVVSQTINGGAATTLNYSPAITSPQTTGTAFSITITGTDQFGNNANGALTMSASSGTITPSSATLSNGTVTTSETLTAPGSITIKATASTNANVSQTITVNFGSSNTNYFITTGSGNWNVATTWLSSYDNVNYYPATIAPPTTSTTTTKGITIQSGHTIAFTASGNVDSIYIQSGGELDVNNGVTMTVNNGTGITYDIDVAGTIKNLGTITLSGAIEFENGAIYNHAENAGSIPTATWNTGSTCLITGTTATAPVNMAQTFYHLTWNSPINAAITWGNSIPTNINGDLTFISTGTGSLRMSNSGATLTVAGNLNMQGGTFDCDNAGTTASTLNINGNVVLTGGNFQPNGGPTKSTLAHAINVKGNWSNNGGTYTAGSETVTFSGTSAQTINGSTSTTFNNLVISNTNASGLTVATNTNAALVTLNNTSASTEVLSISSGIILAVSGNIVLNSTDANLTNSITGAGSITAASLNIGITETPFTIATRVHALNFNGPSLILSGNININSYRGSSSSRVDNGTFNFQSGTITVVGIITLNSASTGNTSTFDMTVSPASGILNLTGASPFSGLSGTAVNVIKLNGSNSSVNYVNGNQNIYATTYSNLGVSGGGIKSLTAAISASGLNFSSDNATTGKIDASAFVLTLTSPNISNASSSGYVITGNGSGTGTLTASNVSASAFTLPVGTLSDYLPATITPHSSGLNWSANVFTPATTDATYGTGNVYTGTGLNGIVNAIWIITPSTTSTTADLTLNWTSDLEGSSFQGYHDVNIGISHFSGGAWQDAIATSASHSNHTVTATFNSFSPFGIGAIGNPLPVTLINFRAILNSNNSVSLTWQTVAEENSNYFDVQRSDDGKNWSSIGTVEAQGNSDVTVNYSEMDLSPLKGADYYRLRLVNTNGSSSYSDIRVITMNAITAFRIFPNPATDYVNVSLGQISNNSVVRMFNLSGQVVFSQQLNNASGNTISVPVHNLAEGTYTLQVMGSDGTQQSGRVIIVR